MKQHWHVTLQDCATRCVWDVEVIAEPPMAQANAEVQAIKAAQVERGHEVRCLHSRFLREEP